MAQQRFGSAGWDGTPEDLAEDEEDEQRSTDERSEAPDQVVPVDGPVGDVPRPDPDRDQG